MSDLSEMLATEAVRLQPAHQPAFTDLVRVRARRNHRNRLVSAVAVVVALGTGGAALSAHEPGVPDPSGVVSGPAGSAPGVAVTGTLKRIGGPDGVPPRGIAGTVHFQAVDGTVTSTVAAQDGHFSISVPAGRYIVTGHSRPARTTMGWRPSSRSRPGSGDQRLSSTSPRSARPPFKSACPRSRRTPTPALTPGSCASRRRYGRRMTDREGPTCGRRMRTTQS